MANPEHLDILKQGVEVWNRWREEKPEVMPDLKFADLKGVFLKGANLINANMIEVDLTSANLTGAILSDADLTNAKLTSANLRDVDLLRSDLLNTKLKETDLSGADLFFADLTGADLTNTVLRRAVLHSAVLTGANLTGTDLRNAVLRSTDLSGAKLFDAVFGDTDLSDAIGLEKIRYLGPSHIDFWTLSKSGKLPGIFLHGVGLPNNFIESIPSLLASSEALQFSSCFISYSSKNEGFANRLHADLQDKGVICWFAPEDMKIGDKVRQTIEGAIRLHDKLILILSETSIDSDWVEHEVSQALEREEKDSTPVLFPIRIDDAVMDAGFGWAKRLREAHRPTGRHIGNFTDWKNPDSYQKAFERLLRDLKA